MILWCSFAVLASNIAGGFCIWNHARWMRRKHKELVKHIEESRSPRDSVLGKMEINGFPHDEPRTHRQ